MRIFVKHSLAKLNLANIYFLNIKDINKVILFIFDALSDKIRITDEEVPLI
jgi:hypothetical protein